MITRVMGKKIENIWHCEWNSKEEYENGEKKYVFTAKPELKCEKKVVGHDEICNFEGEIQCNKNSHIFGLFGVNEFNISENETVKAEESVFRADLGETFVYCDKVLEETDTNKEKEEGHYNRLIKKFNATMIDQDEEMKAYCKLHHLKPEDTDVDDLFKIVHPNWGGYHICNGRIIGAYYVSSNSSWYDYEKDKAFATNPPIAHVLTEISTKISTK